MCIVHEASKDTTDKRLTEESIGERVFSTSFLLHSKEELGCGFWATIASCIGKREEERICIIIDGWPKPLRKEAIEYRSLGEGGIV